MNLQEYRQTIRHLLLLYPIYCITLGLAFSFCFLIAYLKDRRAKQEDVKRRRDL